MQHYSVSGLIAEVDALLTARYPRVLVEGEIRQLSQSPAGHVFLTLTDGQASVQAVAWRSTWRGIRHRPREGEQVLVRGRLSLYAQRGAFQLYVSDIRPAGLGRLAREIAARRARLEAEGLTDPRRKRPLPTLPRVVGVATSLRGAALQDFLRVSGERFPAARVLVAGCTVQGPTAPAEILRALELLVEDGRAEVLVVTRGGGSAEDLLAFQDEGLARFLAELPVPVVSAVGHEVDTTLADLVADVVVPTPTAAAVRVLPDGAALTRRILEAGQRLDEALVRWMALRRERLRGLEARLRHPSVRLAEIRRTTRDLERRLAVRLGARVGEGRTRVASAHDRLEAAGARRVQGGRRRLEPLTAALHRAGPRSLASARARLDALEARLRALSPRAVLARGYAAVVGPDGVVRRPDQAPAGTRLTLELEGGRLGATSLGPVEP